MGSKFQNITFYMDEDVSEKELRTYNDIKIEYDGKEFSSNGNGNFSIYLNDSYLSFEVDVESKRITNFCGIYPFKNIGAVNIQLPVNASKGILTVKESKEMQRGCGTRIKFDCTPYYDEKNRILILGKFSKNKSYCQFFENGYIQLDKNGFLTSIMLTDISLNNSLEL